MKHDIIKYNYVDSLYNDAIKFTSTHQGIFKESDIPQSLNTQKIFDNKTTISNKIVIGTDDRKVIKKTNFFPISTIAKLIITFPSNRKYLGTGTIISNHHLMTVGHNIFKKNEGGWAKSINIYPAKSGKSMPFGATTMTNMYIPKGWRESNDLQYDFGIIEFKKSYKDITGCIGLLYSFNGLKNVQARIIGYPIDRNKGKYMFFSKGLIYNSNDLAYSIDTNSGQSGSGIFYVKSDKVFLIGLHSREKNGKNYGVNFDKDIFEFIHNIIN